MPLRAALQYLLLGSVCACLCPTNGHAQSASGSGSCPTPVVSDDDFTEMTGKKVFPKAIIDDVTFDGPVSLPPATLDELLTSIKQKKSSTSISDWLEETVEIAVRGAWQNNGYFKVKVSWQTIPHLGDPDYQHFSVVFHVDEGLQYRLGEIRFRTSQDPTETQASSTTAARSQMDELNDSESGSADSEEPANNSSRPTLRKREPTNDDEPMSASTTHPPRFPEEELRKLIPLQQGDILSSEKIREGLDALRKLYGSHGYIDFTPTPETEVDEEHQVVSILLVLDEQPQYRIGKIRIVGLSANAENALIWKIKPGDIFNNDLFKQFFEDNQPILPAGSSSAENSEFTRKDGIVDIKLKFSPCWHQ